MKKPKMIYSEQEDISHFVIAEEEEANSVELSPNITAELNEKGEIIGLNLAGEHVCARRDLGGSIGSAPQPHQHR
jgi:hypothetical protein